MKLWKLILLAPLLPFFAHANGETTSPNMGLSIPTVGVTTGPQWAADVNSDLDLIDSHDHTPGNGVQITPYGLNISSDLSCQSNNLTNIKASRFTAQSAVLAGAADLGELYVVGVDLYYNDVSGNQIRITQSGSVSGASGTITGLPSGTASAAFSSGSGSFIFQQATSTGANLDVGSIAIRYPGSYPTPSGNYIQLQAPTSLATGYAFTLPALLPGTSGAFLTSSTAGVVSYTNADNSTLQVSGASLLIKSGGVTATQLASNAVTTAKINAQSVTTAKIATGAVNTGQIASATIVGGNVADNINLPGTTVQENAKNVVVSNTNASTSLSVVRGGVLGSSVSGGEGFTVVNSSTGIYTVTFTTAFADTPIITANAFRVSPTLPINIVITAVSTSAFTVDVFSSVSLSNETWNFIAIGPRL